jgi:thioredoxin reductase (NADPH)
METSLPGIFACGDITGTPYQYVKAAGEGNVAAISAAGFVDRRRRSK